MRFWDASALLPLLVKEPTSQAMMALLRKDATMAVWWATPIECASALARLERDAQLGPHEVQRALRRLTPLQAVWHEVTPSGPVRDTAIRLLRVHPLRAADACQLAAAIVAAEQQPGTLSFVCLDQRLAQAAEREGFPVVTS